MIINVGDLVEHVPIYTIEIMSLLQDQNDVDPHVKPDFKAGIVVQVKCNQNLNKPDFIKVMTSGTDKKIKVRWFSAVELKVINYS